MSYWEGYMDWPLKKGWRCEICGHTILIWGISTGCCRCDICHTEYTMYGANEQETDTPICRIRPDYYDAWKALWQELKKPIELTTDVEWNNALKKFIKEAQNG